MDAAMEHRAWKSHLRRVKDMAKLANHAVLKGYATVDTVNKLNSTLQDVQALVRPSERMPTSYVRRVRSCAPPLTPGRNTSPPRACASLLHAPACAHTRTALVLDGSLWYLTPVVQTNQQEQRLAYLENQVLTLSRQVRT